jgi:hypothetical protein
LNLQKERNRQPQHRGFIVANQRNWTLASLIVAMDRLLTEATAEEWFEQVRWLSDWRG